MHSHDQDHELTVQNLKVLNRNQSNAFEPVQRLQYDYRDLLRPALERAADQEARMMLSPAYGVRIRVAKLELPGSELILMQRVLNVPAQGPADIALLKSTRDDRHIMLWGESMKGWLHYGVSAYELPGVLPIENEATELMSGYMSFSDSLRDQSGDTYKLRQDIAETLKIVEGLPGIYTGCLQKVYNPALFVNPAMFAPPSKRSSSPRPTAC